MAKNTNLIVFTGGGTAGHVFPAFPVIERLRAEGRDILWIGSSRGMERQLVEEAGIPYRGVPSGKLRRYFSFRNFTDLFLICGGFFKSFLILARLRPAVLMSKGGFVSVPPVAAARLLRIPSLTHESDVDPGLATRLNLKLGSRPLLAYEDTRDYLDSDAAARALVTGNPVRDSLLAGNRDEGRRIAGLDTADSRPLILVLGGSQGAREVNNLITGSLDTLIESAAIVHQTGSGNPAVEDRPGYLSRPFFSEELPHLLAAADFAVARSGAGSLWELAATGTPALFVPLRGATRGDQLLNASKAEKTGMSITLSEDADPVVFVDIITTLLADTPRLNSMAAAAAAFPARGAADTITGILKEYL